MTTTIPEAIAHRGSRDRYPENSLPAFAAAVDAGADAIELDVHATSDGVVVVHHDANLAPASTSRFAGRAIDALAANQLSEYELSPGVPVPTLEEVLREITPRAKVYIEIKAPAIERAVAHTISRVSSAAAKCAVHSFDHRISKTFASLTHDVATGILIVAYPIDSAAMLKAADARDLWAQREFIDEDLITGIHGMGGRVIAWTCDAPEEWDRLRELGVDGICTDRIGGLVAHLRS